MSITCLRVTLPTLVLLGSLEPAAILAAFHLPVFQFHRSCATENGDGDTEFAAFRIDFLDDAGLVLEWAIRDFHRFANLKADFRFHLFFALFHLSEHAVYL